MLASLLVAPMASRPMGTRKRNAEEDDGIMNDSKCHGLLLIHCPLCQRLGCARRTPYIFVLVALALALLSGLPIREHFKNEDCDVGSLTAGQA